MHIEVNGTGTFVSTGGREFDPKGEVLLFIHGSGQSHLSWTLQGRFFANRGWQVLAPDLPGHNLSQGEPLASCEAVADWCVELLDALGVEKATVIGHSQGGLVALSMSARHSDRVKKLALLGSAEAIPVNDFLIDLATKAEAKAINFMVSWSHGSVGHKFDHTMPGQSHMATGREVMGQNAPGVLLNDLKACNAYSAGSEDAANVSCPTLIVLARQDRMVPAKFGAKLGGQIANSETVMIEKSGHFLHIEKSVDTNAALRPFFPNV